MTAQDTQTIAPIAFGKVTPVLRVRNIAASVDYYTRVLGFKVDLAFRSPDFVISNFQNEFCIEAVIASNARGEDAEWERDMKAQPDPEQVLKTAVLRLSNAVHSKSRTMK